MKKTFKNKLRKTILLFLAGFLFLFCFRLIYGYTKKTDGISRSVQFFESVKNVRRNFASQSYKFKSAKSATAATQAPVSVDQKYEKIAQIRTASTKFEQQEKLVRNEIESNNALIQFEQKNGNKGTRNLHLVIGVPPENFDTLYQQLIRIGKVESKEITKKDKTNEYKELNAKKLTLEKIRQSLIELKSKGGKIQEFVALENRILEIEEQLQNLGVNLGDFDDENEFCTIKFSMSEVKVNKISFMHRVKVALEWTVKIYLGMMAALFFIVLTSFLLLLILEKLGFIKSIMKEIED